MGSYLLLILDKSNNTKDSCKSICMILRDVVRSVYRNQDIKNGREYARINVSKYACMMWMFMHVRCVVTPENVGGQICEI